MKKTNAMRLLDRAGISYHTTEYEADENDLSGVHVAQQTRIPVEQLFKTLVTRGEKLGYLVFCIPAAKELDVKKAAELLHEKKIELVPVKELPGLTGYIRGGCSPVGMKKKYPTYFDQSAASFGEITVSAGIRGCQLTVNREQLIHFLDARLLELTSSPEVIG